MEIRLTQNRVALIDDEDFDRINAKKWQFDKDSGYATRRFHNPDGRCQKIRMHREVMFFPEEQMVDHWDRNRLNNQKDNLRPTTPDKNSRNRKPYDNPALTSTYKGVYWRKDRQKWCAQIKFNGKKKHLGCFDKDWQAAEAYDVAAIELFGEFAAPNFPGERKAA